VRGNDERLRPVASQNATNGCRDETTTSQRPTFLESSRSSGSHEILRLATLGSSPIELKKIKRGSSWDRVRFEQTIVPINDYW